MSKKPHENPPLLRGKTPAPRHQDGGTQEKSRRKKLQSHTNQKSVGPHTSISPRVSKKFPIFLRASVLLPLPVQNLISKYMLSDICYRKAHVLVFPLPLWLGLWGPVSPVTVFFASFAFSGTVCFSGFAPKILLRSNKCNEWKNVTREDTNVT